MINFVLLFVHQYFRWINIIFNNKLTSIHFYNLENYKEDLQHSFIINKRQERSNIKKKKKNKYFLHCKLYIYPLLKSKQKILLIFLNSRKNTKTCLMVKYFIIYLYTSKFCQDKTTDNSNL